MGADRGRGSVTQGNAYIVGTNGRVGENTKLGDGNNNNKNRQYQNYGVSSNSQRARQHRAVNDENPAANNSF